MAHGFECLRLEFKAYRRGSGLIHSTPTSQDGEAPETRLPKYCPAPNAGEAHVDPR
jgi:hypothetical protein